MKRLFLCSILGLTLVAPSIPAVAAQAKAGASCKTQGITSTVKNLKYTCLKTGGKLVWSAGKKVSTPKPSASNTPQIATITFENLESNIENIAQVAWAKSNPLWTKYEKKIQSVQLLFGPTKKPLNCFGGLHEITKISNFWGKYKQPEKSVVIYAAPVDAKWAQGEFIRTTGNAGPVLGSTTAGSASVTTNGIGQINLYVSGQETPSGCGGGIEKHEYTHVVQFSQRSKAGQLLNSRPPTWFIEGQAEFAGGSEFPIEYYKKFSLMNRLLPQNTLKDSEPSTIAAHLQDTASLSGADYTIGFQVIEILAAIGGPNSTMDVFVEMANGKSFNEAFEAVYKISWAVAVPIISNVVSAQIKSNQSTALAQFVAGKGEIGTFKWPARGYFDEALFN
jgi:hypothetical protein